VLKEIKMCSLAEKKKKNQKPQRFCSRGEKAISLMTEVVVRAQTTSNCEKKQLWDFFLRKQKPM